LEYPEHGIEQGYADIITTLIITFFYGPLMPIAYFFAIGGIAFYYVAEKVFY
jgi:hypothetical protein